MSKIRRFAPFVFGLPLALVATVALAFQYRIHLSNRLQSVSVLPSASAPARDSAIIVFAPHCDDESIATGGLLQVAKEAGCEVTVVLLTNGDGFRVAAHRELKDLRLTPQEYVQFGEERQRDTYKAMSELEIPEDSVIFLGYPDHGISPMWSNYWDRSKPYKSQYTRLTSSPYADSYRKGALHCGQNVFDDIRSILMERRPTDIYIPHPSDDHADHAASYAFITAALASLEATEGLSFSTPRVHTYLVHRGDWPEPLGWKPKASMGPPAAMARLDTEWDRLPLTHDMLVRKRRAIRAHKTQVAIMGKFLMGFVRKNELFGRVAIPTIPSVREGAISIDGSTSDWADIAPVGEDPVADQLLRTIEKAGDVKYIYLCSDSRNLYLRVDFTRNLSRRVTYHIGIRSFADDSAGVSTELWGATIDPPRKCNPAGTYFAWRGRTLEVKIPRSAFGNGRRLFVSVDTSTMRLRIDKTGWRGYILAPGV